MKTFVRIVLVLFVGVALAWAQTNDILYGGDFEIWDGGLPFGWTQSTTGFSIVQSNDPVHGGASSALIVLRSTRNQDLDHEMVVVYPGESYTYSLWVYDTSFAKARLAVIWYDENQNEITRNYTNQYSSNQSGWQQLVFDVTAPDNAHYAVPRIRFYDESGFSDSAYIWIDDAEFVGPDHRVPVILRAQIGGDSHYRSFWVDGSWDDNGNYDPWWRGDWVELRDDGVWPDEVAEDDIFSGVVYLNPNIHTNYWWWVGSEPFWSPEGSAWLESGPGISVSDYTTDTIMTDPLFVDPSDQGYNQWVIVLAGEQNGWNNADDNLVRNGWVWSNYFYLDPAVVGDTFEFKFAVMHSWVAAYGDGGIGGTYPNYKYPVPQAGTYLIGFDDSTNTVIFEPVEVVPLVINEFIVTPTSAEAIEIYNPNQSDVDLSDYFLVIDGATFSDTVAINSGVTVPAGGYVVLNDDNTAGISLPNEGAVISIYNGNGELEDMVGYGIMGPAPAPIYRWSTAKVSDTGNDAVDYNMDPSPTMGEPNDAPPTALGNTTVYLNEVGPGSYKSKFFELYNAGDDSVDISNWMVVVDDDYYVPDGTVLGPGDVFVVYQDDFPRYFDMDASRDNIYLFNADGERLDQMGWSEDPGSQSYAVMPDGDRTTFDGYDNETSVDFELANPTPGQLNQPPVEPVVVILSAQVGGDSHYRSFWVNGSWDATGHYDPNWSGPMVELKNDGVWPDTSAEDDIFTGYVMLYPHDDYYWWWVGSENDYNSFLESGIGIMVDGTSDTVYAQTCYVDPSDQNYNLWVINVTGSFNNWDPTIDNTFRIGWKWFGIIPLTAGHVEYKYTVMHSWNAAYGDGGIGGAGQNYSFDVPEDGNYLFVFDDYDNSQAVYPLLTIHQIQGEAASSPYVGQTVATAGVVTGVTNRGFYIQDRNDNSWCGIWVYTRSTPDVSVGDSVLLIGEVSEYYDLTEIYRPDVYVLASGLDLPEPILVSTGAANDEQYEGMLLRVENAVCVNPDLGYGEWLVDDGSGPLRIDDYIYQFSPDSGMVYNITGILHYSYGNYKLEPRGPEDIEVVQIHDVALTQVVEPAEDIYNIGTVLAPSVMLRNNGTSAEDVTVSLTVSLPTAKPSVKALALDDGTSKQDSVVYSETVSVSIEPNDSAVVVFSDLELAWSGDVLFAFDATIPEDINPDDNHIEKTIFVATHDAGIVEIVSPSEPIYHLTDVITPEVVVSNNGNVAEDVEVHVRACLYGEEVYSDMATVSVDAGGTASVSFDGFTIGQPGDYDVVFWTSVCCDLDPTNDTLMTSFTVPEHVVPDTQSFFTASVGSQWEFGTPTTGPGQAYEGENAWATVLDGNYPDNADWRLMTPPITITGEHPLMMFYHWYAFSDQDGGMVEYSTDFGETWTPIEPEGGYPGYSDVIGGNAYVGNSDGWQLATFDLSSLPSGVYIFAFHFMSNDAGNDAGWYLDNFMVTDLSSEVPGDVRAIDVVLPDTTLRVGGMFHPSVVVENNLFGPTASFYAYAKIFGPDGSLLYNYRVLVDDLAPGEADTVYFPSGFVPIVPGTYRLELTVSKPDDPIPMNNTLIATFEVSIGKALAGAERGIPRDFYLAAARPNPFRTSTTIEFGLPKAANVEIGIYDATGRLVKMLVNGELAAGVHTVSWDGTNTAGNRVSAGLYFVRMRTSTGFSTVRRMLMLR